MFGDDKDKGIDVDESLDGERTESHFVLKNNSGGRPIFSQKWERDQGGSWSVAPVQNEEHILTTRDEAVEEEPTPKRPRNRRRRRTKTKAKGRKKATQ